MQTQLQARRLGWIETFRSRSRLDLIGHWLRSDAPERGPALEDPWGREHRPDWVQRGLLVWPRGGVWRRLRQEIRCPPAWRDCTGAQARLVLSWWADAVRIWVDGQLVHEGDLFDTRCRWPIPSVWLSGRPIVLELELRSPLHDDGALISSAIVLEPETPSAADGAEWLLLPQALDLALAASPAGPEEEADTGLPESCLDLDPLQDAAAEAVADALRRLAPAAGQVHWFGHAHLDLAWLWPVADTWEAAERTFRSALALMERFPDLHFAHSTPALYAWLERFRPALFARIQAASSAGRWEPINGPWVETDCVLIGTASLRRQFALGQAYSHRAFPDWRHELAWLPDSFGFAAGLPAIAAMEGVRWFCTHKLAWNASNPFPHRLFRWRSRGAAEVLALMLPPIGTDGDPGAIQAEQRAFEAATALDQALWIPGVGDHGGGPTAEMLEQLQLWEGHPQVSARRPGSLRDYLQRLEAHIESLPVWRDELYLELHRGCPTSRPDQKRHNRSLERLLREADLVAALLSAGFNARAGAGAPAATDWRPLLFQQFHDILPGTSIPEVFEQAEPVWRASRRQALRQRNQGLRDLLGLASGENRWCWVGLQPLARWSPLLRLPRGHWTHAGQALAVQDAPTGGSWVQLPCQEGVAAVALEHVPLEKAALPQQAAVLKQPPVRGAVQVTTLPGGGWRICNGLVSAEIDASGLRQLRDAAGAPQLSAPLEFRRFGDHGEFWDAWDLAADYREHPLPLEGPLDAPQLVESGPLLARCLWRCNAGASRIRVDLQLRADHPWIEITCSIDWCQTHELLRLELPLATEAVRWAADTSGGVLERPALAQTAREQARWEVPVISWLASQAAAPAGGLAVLLDGPQGVDLVPDRLGVSLLRGPTWPDPSADRGWHRQRLALMPVPEGWERGAVPQAALAFRETGWWGKATTAGDQRLLPGLPPGLVPIALTSEAPGGAVRLQVHNPGGRRQQWKLPQDAGWTVRPCGASDGDGEWGEAISVRPGALVDLELRRSDP